MVPKEAEAMEVAVEAMKVALAGPAVKPKERAAAEVIAMKGEAVEMEAVKAEAMEVVEAKAMEAVVAVEVLASLVVKVAEAVEVGKGTVKALQSERASSKGQ